MSGAELAWLADQASRRSVIAEVGCWKGRSTKAIALATQGSVYTVDNWLSTAPSEALRAFGEWKEVSARGSLAVYADFMRNIGDEFASGKVRPIMADSVDGASILASILGASSVGMVFIDADHDYGAVAKDIAAWRPMVKPGGLLCGHDYAAEWPGVKRAVKEAGLDFRVADGTKIWYVTL